MGKKIFFTVGACKPLTTKLFAQLNYQTPYDHRPPNRLDSITQLFTGQQRVWSFFHIFIVS